MDRITQLLAYIEMLVQLDQNGLHLDGMNEKRIQKAVEAIEKELEL